MIRQFKLFVALFSWFLATGAQWDLLQVFAWGKMFAGYSETMGLRDAVGKTFDGEMCCLCKAVNKAKQQRNETPSLEASKGKLVLICQPVKEWCFAIHGTTRRIPDRIDPASLPRAEPPTPPPRFALMA